MIEFESRRLVTPTINLSALIDVAFILVIFIVLIANFHKIRELDISLPESETAGMADPTSLIITVPATGPFDVQGRTVEPEELRAVLKEMRPAFTSVLLVADQAASIQRAVTVLSDAQAIGFSSVGIATQAPSEVSR